ncbi:MFS transporter [Desulfuromonas versatilis]|uniref:MFS transporter n=1 Tax=Desulfuromonas versatilis TaxID=2802975 RepID=A0ABN6DX89_9BACT|nr:MFS transporter [Desulfuromonas versatilis]BCR04632.1 MFS transporter [Desulfuromonas versatilis]
MSITSNIPKLYAFSFLKMALFPMAIITLFWKDHIGLSLTQILVLQGLFSVATLLMEYPSGYLSDRLGYRFSLNLASLFGIAGWTFYTVADSFSGVLIAECLLGVSYAFISGSDSALLFESLRTENREEEYARFDGRMTGFAQTGEAAGALFAGLLYASAPLLPFFIQIAVWVLALLICRSLAEAPADTEAAPASHLREALGTCRLVFIENRHLRWTVLLGTVLGISSFFPVWLIQPYMQQAGVPLSWFGPVWAGANLTVALFSVLSHRFRFALGDRGMTALFLVLILAGYLGLGLSAGIWSFLFYYLLTAMRGMQGPILRQHLQTASRRANRASILSLKSLSFRLLFVATGPLVGHFADTRGLQPTFLVLALAFAATIWPLAVLFLKTAPKAAEN